MVRQYEYQPCIPTRGTKVPAGPDWLHEIKHDGYRLIVQREGKRVRLLTRRGYDWSDRYPLIVEAALRLRKTSFVIDGEAVVLGSDGISDFDALHGGRRNADVRLYAFDLLADDGVDMRDQPLQIRKVWLGKLLKRSGDGILLNEHEAGDIGPRLFEQACKMGLEGIVSKASRKNLQGRPVCILDQGQEPQVPCHAPRRRGHLVTRERRQRPTGRIPPLLGQAGFTKRPIRRRKPVRPSGAPGHIQQ
jgi:bifunctional non-homologous end joining protein LigD